MSACATAAAYAPLCPFSCARCSAVLLHEHRRHGGRSAVGPCGAARRYPYMSLMDAFAPAPSSAAIAPAWPL